MPASSMADGRPRRRRPGGCSASPREGHGKARSHMNRNTLQGCFVTGTDTGVGKTRVSAALLHRLRRAGLRSAGFKPVAAGTSFVGGERVNEDVRALRDAGMVRLSDAEISPYQFDAACAPHIAASLADRVID